MSLLIRQVFAKRRKRYSKSTKGKSVFFLHVIYSSCHLAPWLKYWCTTCFLPNVASHSLSVFRIRKPSKDTKHDSKLNWPRSRSNEEPKAIVILSMKKQRVQVSMDWLDHREGETNGWIVLIPRYVRVNTHRMTMDEAIEAFKKEGYTFKQDTQPDLASLEYVQMEGWYTLADKKD